MAGRGRAPKARGIASVRELTPDDLVKLKNGERGKLPAVVRFRDSHHKVARLVATGMRLNEVAFNCGYSIARVYSLTSDPTFKELVEFYKQNEDDSYKSARDDYNELLWANKLLAERRVNDMLVDDDKEFSMRELLNCSRDAADRTGYGKRSVNFNVNADFAAQLDQAIRRSSKVIEGVEVSPSTVTAPQRMDTELLSSPSPIRRRA